MEALCFMAGLVLGMLIGTVPFALYLRWKSAPMAQARTENGYQPPPPPRKSRRTMFSDPLN